MTVLGRQLYKYRECTRHTVHINTQDALQRQRSSTEALLFKFLTMTQRIEKKIGLLLPDEQFEFRRRSSSLMVVEIFLDDI